MTNKKLSLFYEDPRFLIFLLPKELRKGDVVPTIFSQRKKKEVDLFVPDVNLFSSVSFNEILTSTENRFGTYEKTSFPYKFFSLSVYNFSESGIDLALKRSRYFNQLSFFKLFRLKNWQATHMKRNLFFMSRSLSIQKNSPFLHHFAGKAKFFPFFSRKKKRKKSLALIFSSFPAYGYLQPFCMSKWQIQRRLSKNVVKFYGATSPYFFSSPRFSSMVTFSKPRYIMKKLK